VIDAILLAVALGFWALLVGLETLGSRVRICKNGSSSIELENKHFDQVVTSVFGLLALLLGFTFSMALDHFEQRSRDVVAEANAISSAHENAAFLASKKGAALQGTLQAYAELRLRYGQAMPADVQLLQTESVRFRKMISEASFAAALPIANTLLGTMIMQSSSAVGDVGVQRDAAMKAQLPLSVFVVLILFTCIAVTMTGYAYPFLAGDRRPISQLICGLLVITLFLIIDLDRPRGGTIRISQDAMKSLVMEFRAQRATRVQMPA
jgi:hypothetical protein